MQLSLRLALLLNLLVISAASAQSTPGADDFSSLSPGRKLAVVSDSGTETRGRLLRSTPETVAIAVKGREVVFRREQVTSVFELGDSLRNGIKRGGIAGVSLGALVGFVFAEAGYTSSDHIGIFIASTVGFGLMGMAAGAGIDALISGRRLVYEKSQPAGGAANSIVPAIAPSRACLKVGVSW